jgi:hypothetical protein
MLIMRDGEGKVRTAGNMFYNKMDQKTDRMSHLDLNTCTREGYTHGPPAVTRSAPPIALAKTTNNCIKILFSFNVTN